MAERLSNSSLSVSGLTLVRNCHMTVSPSIPNPPGPGSKITFDPILSSISQFSLSCSPPLAADVPVTIRFRLTGNSTGSVFAVVMGAATSPHSSGDGDYELTVTPLADTSSVLFRTAANTDGTISNLSVDDGA